MSACGGATGYTPGGLVVVAVGRASWTERGRWVDKGTQVSGRWGSRAAQAHHESCLECHDRKDPLTDLDARNRLL